MLGINTIDLYLTGKCNYECEYCYGENDANPHMSKSMIDMCLDFAKKSNITTVELCGGEPLMSPNFEYALKSAKGKGFKIILRTNAILLDKYIELVASECEWVGISLDGMEEGNAKMRKSRSEISAHDQFNIPINNIKRLKEINPNVKILLASVASNVNYEDLVNLRDYIVNNNINIDKWKIYQFIVDKFRSVTYEEKYKLSSSKFRYLINNIETELPNKAQVILQRSDIEGAGGNCLLVYHDGTIKILDTIYGVIGYNSAEEILKKLSEGKILKYIKDNKRGTYEN